ncbi:hypothetical protein XI06_13445 [Bradyrhizobium sp. CCBAU 11434]|nr:hypothetical protein [Bradyrhizobium sp. CCBAU 11434]
MALELKEVQYSMEVVLERTIRTQAVFDGSLIRILIVLPWQSVRVFKFSELALDFNLKRSELRYFK